jgi:hypothetical protein
MRLFILFILLIFPFQSFAAVNVWLDNSLTKYRQDGEDGTSGSSSLSISMAKNEIESFQVMLYADGESLTNVDVTVSNLTKGSDTISDIFIYKQWYHYTKSVDVKGVAGDWEDQGSNIWRKNIGASAYVWSGTPGSLHDQEVGFYYGGTAQTNWHDGNNETVLDAAYKWKYDGTYLYVYCTSNPATYFAEIHAPNRKSRVDYPSGMYPDALLPKVDRYFGETRNTFPFSVSSGKVQGVWVDVGTTSTTPAGTYTGTVTVSAQGKADVTRTINVTVYNFALPSTSTFHTNFIFSQSMMTYGHGLGASAAQNGTQPAIDLAHTYMTAFLYHKMSALPTNGKSMIGASYMPWDSGSKILTVANWEPWETIVSDVFAGTAITSGPYSGGKYALKRVPEDWPCDSATRSDIADADKETATRQYFQIVYDKWESEGWDAWGTLLFGTIDEPRTTKTKVWRGATQNYVDIAIDQAQDVAAINTGTNGQFRRVYTNSKMVTELLDFYDYGFSSANTYTFVCPGWDKTCTGGGTKVSRDTYPGYPNDELWGYLACDNNGCNLTGPASIAGQIDWSADATSMLNRQAGLIWAKYELTGTAYWQTTYDNQFKDDVVNRGDPYDSIWGFGSNGDGHLIYPGVASATGRTLSATTPVIGGTHDIPIESIRMKHIRDAIEDWEYVQAAKTRVGKTAAFVELDKAFTDADIDDAYWNLNTSQTNFASVRSAIAGLAAGTGGGGGAGGKWKIKAITDDN